jgi:hypothetical protein
LTAIALVFAIFQLNLAPAVSLLDDKVDAPLDAKHRERYAKLVSSMSKANPVLFIATTDRYGNGRAIDWRISCRSRRVPHRRCPLRRPPWTLAGNSLNPSKHHEHITNKFGGRWQRLVLVGIAVMAPGYSPARTCLGRPRPSQYPTSNPRQRSARIISADGRCRWIAGTVVEPSFDTDAVLAALTQLTRLRENRCSTFDRRHRIGHAGTRFLLALLVVMPTTRRVQAFCH